MKRGRMLLVVALVAAILATGVVQTGAFAKRRQLLRSSSSTSGQSSLASMDSFALALVLGGLRGPLVMLLWTQSESAKSNKTLEGVETQIEWIRLLQPEFDSVHLFQIWNKAYNLSVQMASLSNKYAVILDALDYARSVDHERPDDINILMAVGSIFQDKFCNSAEKDYYRKRVRQDSLYRAQTRVAREAGVRPTRYESVLTPEGNIRPDLLAPHQELTLPASRGAGIADYYDGAELQFLERYQPYSYGLSPAGLAYNYLKRTQLLQRTTGQKHLQMSPMVVDSRPCLAIKGWAQEEWELGARAEATFWGLAVPSERFDVLKVSATQKPDQKVASPASSAAMKEALFQYAMSLKLMEDAETEFRRHMANPEYASDQERYMAQLEDVAAFQHLIQADGLYLKALSLSGDARKQAFSEAADLYQKANHELLVLRLRYFIEPEVIFAAFPKGYDRNGLGKMADAQLEQIRDTYDAKIKQRGYDPNGDETKEYNTYIHRAATRAKLAAEAAR